MINSIGLPNKGLEGFLQHDLPGLGALPVPLIVNVMGGAHDEVGQLVSACAARPGVSALELNVSCPNVGSGDPGDRELSRSRGGPEDRRGTAVRGPRDDADAKT